VFFATVHGSPKLAPFYATFAVAMCWLYARTETLAAPIAAHMTMNSIACTALLFSGDGTV
jgi:membrane protease YdiL (CAAX protease family)